MRMHMRRFTRLTNAFSKKLENHIASISLCFMVLQLRSHSPDASRYSCNGRWHHRPCMGDSDIVNLLDEKPRKIGRSDEDEGHYGPALGLDPRDQYR
jgi:hypothetical protein